MTSTLTASATVGAVMSTYTITAANTPTSYSATGLPAGLSVNTSNGQITGTPTAAGTVNTTIKATNSAGTGSATLVFTIAAGTQDPLSLASTSATYGTPFTLTSSGGSGTGAVTFSLASAGTAACSLTDSTTMSAASAGDCSITVVKAADANYNQAAATVSVVVGRAAQGSIRLDSVLGTFGTVLPLASSGGSGSGAVTYAVTDAGSAGCSLATSTSMTSTGAGTCLVTVTKALDANYTAVSSAPTSVTFDASAQTAAVVLTSSSAKTYGSALTLAASGGTGTGALSYSVVDPGSAGCSIAGDQLTSTGDVGTTCTVRATRLADTNYLVRASDAQTITVTTRATQPTLTVVTPSIAYRTPMTPTTTGGAGSGPVTFLVTSAGSAGCSIMDGQLRTTGAVGTTCGIAAYKAASTNYLQTSSAELTVTVTDKASQLIDFTAPVDRAFTSTPFTAGASSDSSLGVTLTSASPAVCSASGLTVTMLLPGTCLLDAAQSGDGNYLPAPQVRRVFDITPALQAVTWNPTSGALSTASPFTMSAAVGADGGGVTYTVLDAGMTNCAIADPSVPVLTFDSAGECTVQAQAAATATHLAGTSTKLFTIAAPPSARPGQVPSSAADPEDAPTPIVMKVRSLDPIIENGGLASGTELVTVDGRPVPVRVEANATSTGLDVIGTDWSISVTTSRADGSPAPLAPGGILTASAGGAIDITGSGFDDLSQVRIYLIEQSTYLGSLMADRDGDLSGSLAASDVLLSGTDTLQINGFTHDREVRSISLGITVLGADTPATASVGSRIYFPYASATLTPKARRSLQAMIARLPRNPTISTRLVGALRSTGATEADRSLAWRRVSAISTFLRSRGMPGSLDSSVRRVAVSDDYRDRRVGIFVRVTSPA